MSSNAAVPTAVLRRLADIHTEPDGVLSVYLDLDPSLFPTPNDRESEVESVIDEARQIFAHADVDKAEKDKRTAAIKKLSDMLKDPGLAQDGRRGVASFVAPSADVFEIVRLDEPVAPTVVVDDSPYLRPIADHAGPHTWVVLLVDRRRARLLYGGPRRLIEVSTVEDNTPQHSKPGGWSQAGNQRHSDEAASEHVRDTAALLLEFYERVRFDAIAVAAPDPLYNEVVDALAPELRERVRGRVRIEVGFTSTNDVLEVALPVFEAAREEAVVEILNEIDESARENVAIGIGPVLEALSDGRVDTMVIREDYTTTGARCDHCGWVGLRDEPCPRDGEPTIHRTDIVEEAVQSALATSARVVYVSPEAERQPAEPVVASLRF